MISHERLAVIAVVFTMALGLSLTLGPSALPFYGLALALLACAAVPYLLHTHPSYSFSWPRLIIPASVALVAPSGAHLLAGNAFLVFGVFAPGAALYAAIYAEYLVVRPSTSDRAQLARLTLTLVSFAVAFVLFTLVYETKQRTLISGALVGGMSGLLAWRLFTLERVDGWRPRLYAFAVSVGMGETLWALNYWVLTGIVGGAGLLLTLYVVIGLLRQLLAGELTDRVVLEYITVGFTGLLIVIGASRL